jgi:hypothetical protein
MTNEQTRTGAAPAGDVVGFYKQDGSWDAADWAAFVLAPIPVVGAVAVGVNATANGFVTLYRALHSGQ